MKELFTNIPALVTLLGAVLVAGGTFINALRSAKETADANAEQAKLYKQLSEKSDEIARLNKEIKKWVTGGDTPSIVAPTSVVKGRSDLHISNTEPYPLFDVIVSIQDPDDFTKATREIHESRPSPIEAMDALNKAWRTYPIGTMRPNTGHRIPLEVPDQSEEVRYNIRIQTISGSSFHQLVYRKFPERWLFAIRSYEGSEVVKEMIPPEMAGVFEDPSSNKQ